VTPWTTRRRGATSLQERRHGLASPCPLACRVIHWGLTTRLELVAAIGHKWSQLLPIASRLRAATFKTAVRIGAVCSLPWAVAQL
jgi:hypothetical protein